jgi:hypothetical protein
MQAAVTGSDFHAARAGSRTWCAVLLLLSAPRSHFTAEFLREQGCHLLYCDGLRADQSLTRPAAPLDKSLLYGSSAQRHSMWQLRSRPPAAYSVLERV